MHSAIQDMLKPYDCRTADNCRQALNEIVQEIALLGLYRGGFFTKAAFYRDTALRLGKYFGVSPEIWLNLQVDYDMHVARRTIWPSVEPRVRVRAV